MKLSSLKYSTIKLVIFSSVLLYLGVDLLIWHGPLWHKIHGDTPATPGREEMVAVVYGEPITLNQLNRHEAEQNILAGRRTPEPARRAAMLMDLVRAKLLHIRTRYNDTRLPNCKEAAEAEVEKLATRATSASEFEAQLRSQGYESIAQFTDKLEVTLQSEALLEQAIAEHCHVTDAEVERVYEQLKNELPAPARRQVSHIFLETLNQDSAAIEQKAKEILSRLQNGADFATLARECSQDAHTAPIGGNLGTIEDTGERPLPELPLFGEKAIPAGIPCAVQSKWGWHILQAGEITPAGKRTLDECRESIRSAIESARREQALNAWFTGAVREGFIKKRIQTNVK